MLFETKKDAVHAYVEQMNAIPQGMIKSLMEQDYDSWKEITLPDVGDRVYAYESQSEGEIVEIKVIHDDDEPFVEYVIKLDNQEMPYSVKCDSASDYEEYFEVIRYDGLPMWGTMWSFGDSIDDEWLRSWGGLEEMSRCGFRIYEHDEWGYFFGIDGAGYDFYSAHWEKLYDARGLRWHKDEEGAA